MKTYSVKRTTDGEQGTFNSRRKASTVLWQVIDDDGEIVAEVKTRKKATELSDYANRTGEDYTSKDLELAQNQNA